MAAAAFGFLALAGERDLRATFFAPAAGLLPTFDFLAAFGSKTQKKNVKKINFLNQKLFLNQALKISKNLNPLNLKLTVQNYHNCRTLK